MKQIYSAPSVEIIKTLFESDLLTNTGVVASDMDDDSMNAKKHNNNWDLWDDDFNNQASSYHNNPWSNTQRKLWGD